MSAVGASLRIAFCVNEIGGSTARTEAAEALADELRGAGHDTVVIAADQWPDAATQVVISLYPNLDLTRLHDGVLRVGWATGRADAWVESEFLVAYDQIWAGSESKLERLREETPRAVAVIGAEPEATTGLAKRVVSSLRRGRTRNSARAERVTELLVAPVKLAAPRHALHFGPNYGHDNPYQPMLYSALGEAGFYPVPVPVRGITDFLEERAELGAASVVFHMHWSNPILRDAETDAEAVAATDRFVDAVMAFKASGGRLIWTIHNVLPHEVRFRDEEIRIARTLVAEADLVHVLSRATFDEVAPYYPLSPERTVVVEHSSFEGRYPRTVTSDDARRQLEIPASDRVLIVVGGVRPYKGLDRLLDAFEVLSARDPDLRLLIAGRPGGDADANAELAARCEAMPRVTTYFDYLPDEELQVWFGAADLAVLPYKGILNSSAFWLAQTFGLPVVAPRAGALREFAEAPHIRLFDPTDDDGFTAVLSAAVDEVGDPKVAATLREAALRAAHDRRPEQMAREFAAVLTRL